MKHSSFAVAMCAAALSGLAVPSFGETSSTNELVCAESAIKAPSFEAEVFYSSMKVERGMVENDESVFGYEVALEWYGLFGGVEACYDMTDVNERIGRYNEIASFLGYGLTWADFTAKGAYLYKACGGDEGDTQEVHFELEYETPWVTPFAEAEIDTWRTPGAFYGAFGLVREWELTDALTLVTLGSFGVGNARRNEADFERDAVAAREIRLGAALEMTLCPHVKLVPSIDFYDAFTEAQRAAYDKFNGFFAMAACRLAVDF